ncbi:MAG: PAS domain S-box protein [Ignavibacteriaceae bacterium]|jgi:PAS domain S-box-containing protein|nr:PAS domain S-box protein [Ignavibacteriaceae bacterium]MCW9065473.1 PAS domain S-box protein [Ignavibacteriaceae bacterium]
MTDTKILLVEDEQIVAKFTEKQLSRAGYKVVASAYTGETAIEKVSSLNPDIVLMDIKLVGSMDGIETADHIRKNYQVPVIFLTSLADDESFQRAKIAEPFGYLIKPIDLKELNRVVDMALYKNKIYKELINTRHRFQIATEAAKTIVWELWADENKLIIDSDVPALLDYTEKDLDNINSDQLKYVHKEDKEFVDKTIQDCLDGKSENFEIEHRVYKKDKSVAWLLVRGVLIPSENGGPKRIIGSATDITDRKNYEHALKKSEEKFRNIFESSGIGMALLGPDGQFTKVNNTFCEMLEYKEEEIIGTNFRDITHPGDIDKSLEMLKKLLKDDSLENKSVEKRYLQRKGNIIWALTTISLIRDSDEKPLFFIAQVQDITKRKKFEEQLIKYTEELKLLNVAKDKFFSIISHDLRSPFNSLLGLTEYISHSYDEMTPLEIKNSISNVYNSSKQVYNLILNLLEWSMIQSGRLTVNKSVINLSELGNEIINLYEEGANYKQLKLVNNMDQEILVYADKYMIDTIVRNFVSNSIKFTRPGGQITIKGIINGNNAEVSVTDTGIGINPEDQKNLFRIDEQTRRDGTANEKGTGLGLILCKEFIEKNNGVLWVESEEGKGSRFSFTVPRYLGNLDKLES